MCEFIFWDLKKRFNNFWEKKILIILNKKELRKLFFLRKSNWKYMSPKKR